MTHGDSLTLTDLTRALLRAWATVVVCTLLGIIAAIAVIRLAPPTWTAHASVLVRDASPLPSSLVDALGSGTAAKAAGSLLGGSLKSSVETDLALLKSRELIGEVVDSLGLQVVVTSPHGLSSRNVVQSLSVTGAFRPLKLKLEPSGESIHITGKNVDTTVPPGGTLKLSNASLLLQAPSSKLQAQVTLLDHEDAVTRAAKRLDAEVSGGEVLAITWRGDDSLSAPIAANLLIDRFLIRRKGVDRSLNQRRLDFVTKQIDSIDRALSSKLQAQRLFHESAQTVDPSVSAKTYLESLVRLREQREMLVMEERALTSLQDQLKDHSVQPRQLAAYPAFLRSPAINELLGRIGTLEAERVSLLARQRRDDDPGVLAARASISKLESELTPLAKTYGEAISQQRTALDAEIASINERLARLPKQVEQAFQHEKDVERLSRTSLALNAQRVELRLATIGEGGEARVVDVAQTQWKKSFPSTLLTLVLGTLAGLALGFAVALIRLQAPSSKLQAPSPH